MRLAHLPDEVQPNSMLQLSPVEHLSRRPKANTRVLLFTRAGGRCEFDNCNRYLLTHHVTHRIGYFGEMAHIVAFRRAGPRGQSPLTATERNDVSNLMLLCPTCHKLIDGRPDLYPVETLQGFKKDHEARILMLTEAKADKQTAALVLKAAIGSSPVAIPLADMQSAVVPFYLDQREVHIIDLPSVTEGRTGTNWNSNVEAIQGNTQRFYASLRQTGAATTAVFALAPIPLLVALGSCLSNKFPTLLFQRHRDTDDWRWKEVGDPVEFNCRMLQKGTEPQRVALVCSLSGAIPPADYPSAVDSSFTVYEIAPDGLTPSCDCLRLRESLEAFRACYRCTLQRVTREHLGVQEIHLIPAVPAPAAVAIGLDRMPKAHPRLVVYDKHGDAGFERTIVVGEHWAAHDEFRRGVRSTE